MDGDGRSALGILCTRWLFALLMYCRFDTTATLLSFATALLDKSPAVKAKLHAELDTIVPEDPAAFTQEMVGVVSAPLLLNANHLVR